MLLVLLFFTAGSFAAFSYCYATPSVPFIGTVLWGVLTLLLGAAVVVAYLDTRHKSVLF